MHKAKEIAADLRKLADHYEGLGDVELERPTLTFHTDTNTAFLAAARALPRPINKHYPTKDGDYEQVRINHSLKAITAEVWAWRYVTCRLVEPAKAAVYECDPILSDKEEEEIVQAPTA